VLLDGKEISAMNKKQLTEYRRHDVGFVFQFYNLIGNLTALENVELANQICKEPLDAEQVLRDVGLEARLKNFPSQLSGGEQQRVAIARALVNNPEAIIADEPTGNLDPARSLELMMLLEKINSMGTTVVVVTHAREIVDQFSKRVVAIDGGMIVSDRTGGYYGQPELEQMMAKMDHSAPAKPVRTPVRQETPEIQPAVMRNADASRDTGLEIPGFMRNRSKEQEDRTNG
jgi:putative ABC transport system ATP-binding protein